MFLSVLIAALLLPFPARAAGFAPCFDHGQGGAEPTGAARFYRIMPPTPGHPFPFLTAIPADLGLRQKRFRLIVENVRFTSYKCWDEHKNLTGFDVEMMTEAAYRLHYRYVEFVLRPWNNADVNGAKVPSLLLDLNAGLGDAVSAGMSMTPEREAIVRMVGPIYKAGKKLMARNDNPKISPEKLAALAQVPTQGFEALRGLSVMVQAATIRADFFRKLAESAPGLVAFAEENEQKNGFRPIPEEPRRLVVLETDAGTIEAFIDSHLNAETLGKKFDLVMLDTGSTNDLLEEGKLGVDTRIVTGNLAAAPVLGALFGRGDGVSFRPGSALYGRFRRALAQMIRNGRIDRLVTQWFRDENAADHSWAR